MSGRLIFASIALAAAAASASAQETGSRLGGSPADIPDDTHMSDADRGRATTNAYMACLLRTNPRGIERAIATPAGKFTNAFANIATSDCLRYGELRMPRELMRGSAFVALYRRKFGSREPGLIDTAPDYSAGAGDQPNRQAIALRYYGSCVVRRDAEHSRQFVLAEVAGRDERDALSALAPSLSACLTAGQTLHFSKAVLQGVLAEVLYREAAPTAPKPN